LIDFTPFATGTLYIPALEHLFQDGADSIPLLTIQVASILSASNWALSEPASPLSVPGTSLLVYGSGVLVLIVLSAGIAFSFMGPRFFREFWDRLLRRYRLYMMARFIRRLKQECSQNKNIDPANFLTLLSAKWREFLSLFTGFNCRSLTAGEFLALPLEDTALDPGCLCKLFRKWDTLRFSGRGMEIADLLEALDEVNTLIAVLNKAEKEKRFVKPLTPPAIVKTLSNIGGSL
jgi:hypothetical protein